LKTLPLASVADVIRGVSFSKDEGDTSHSENKLPIIRAGSIQDKLLINEGQIWVPKEKIKKHQIICKDDIVMCTSSGSSDLVGKCAKADSDFKGSFGAFCAGIRADNKKVSSSYLYHFLSSPLFRNWTKSSSGANIKNIRISELASFEIPLPPLAEQKRIAAILDKADAIRRKRQQAIQLADDFLRAVFLDMFGDPVTNPKGWEVRDLKDIAKIQIGPFGTQLHKEDYIENGIPLINPTHIVKGNIVPKSNLTISERKHGSLPEYHLKVGDIIMGRRGEMGRCAIVNEAENGWMCGTGSLYIRPKKAGVFSEYLNKLLSSQAIKNHLESESQGATMANLNKTIVGNIQIPVPSDEALRQFTLLKVKLLNLAKSSSEFRNETIFESLSQKAFSGQL
jgi:type I restriction enzyme S subunit